MRRTVAINLSLLEDLELLPSYRYAGLSWSYSRREVLDQCTRRYFYQYYWDALKDPKLREHARNLRGIKNRHLRAGDLVHLAVSTYLKKRKQGTTLPVDWLTRWARSLFAKDQQYSKHLRAGGHAINRRFPPAALDEILNDVGNGSALLKEADEQMVLCIRNFFEPVFADLRELGALPRSFIEHKLALKGFPAPVSGKIDLEG